VATDVSRNGGTAPSNRPHPKAPRPLYLAGTTKAPGLDDTLLYGALVTGACFLGLLVPVLVHVHLRARTRHHRRFVSAMMGRDW
jgi:hypothetical protein